MKIRVVMPVIGVLAESIGPLTLQGLTTAARADVIVTLSFLKTGPASIESEYDGALAAPGILSEVRKAASEGVDGIIIMCFTDPGLKAARELVTIPVIGLCESSMHLAAMLGHRFSVVTLLERLIPLTEDLAAIYGVKDKLSSVRSIDTPVFEMDRNQELLPTLLVEQAKLAVQKDGAHVIILGCGGMIGLAKEVEEGLKKEGCSVPVIDPAITALEAVEMQIEMGLAHSKKTYPYPPDKEVVGY